MSTDFGAFEGMYDKKSAAQQKRQQDRLMAGVRQSMATVEGRTLLRWIMDQSGALRAAYGQEAGAVQYMQGQRSVGFGLLALVKSENKANIAKLMEDENV